MAITLAARCAAAIAVLFLLQPLITHHKSLAWAQTTSAGVSGRVTDPTGAVIVDAEVEIKSTDTNDSLTVKTNRDGLYNIPSLKPGHYLINVRRPGFKSVTVTDVELNIQDNVVRNFALQVGSITETVTINGDDIHINTTDASVSTVVDQTYIKNMPLNGRSLQDLILLTPGVVTNSPQNGGTLGYSGEFSVNGQRTESNNYTVDGVSATVGAAAGSNMVQGAGASGSVPTATMLGTTQALVSVDSLQEFRVQSSTYSAEYGRNPGGQFAFQTKSGTNQWHGTAFDYLRNNYFDANDWFNDYLKVAQAPLRQNDFGGTLGAPVRIPGLYNGKDKMFFFFSYEGLRLTQPQAASTQFVPDLCMRGSSSACASLNAQYAGTPAGAAIGYPSGGRSPAGTGLLPVMNAFPLPSPNGLEDATNGFGQFIGSWPNPSSLDSVSVRFDHAVSDRLRLFFRFSDTSSSSSARDKSTATLNDTSSNTIRTYTAGASSVFSNRLSNEFRFNYSSNRVTDSEVIDAFGGSTPVNLADALGLNRAGAYGVFVGTYFVSLFQSRNTAAQRQWNLVDTVSLSLGRHQLKFGGDYRRLAPFAVWGNPSGDFFYTSESVIEMNTGGGFVAANAPAYPLYMNSSAFAQDEWRLSQRLTLSLGLRWEVNPAPGVTQGLKPYTFQGSSPSTWTLAPQGTPLWQTTWYNFAPRLGAAYVARNTLGWETVLRGGGGVFFDTGQQVGSLGFNGAPGFTAFTGFGNASFPTLPVAVPAIVNPPNPPYNNERAFAPHLQLPYTIQWNASIEQALGKSQALTVSYVGSHAARLLQVNQFLSSQNPNALFFLSVENGLTSDYDALQVQFRRRLSRGLTALASYAWDHCIDYGSNNYLFGYQRGNCDFDVRHNFSAAFSYDLPNVGHNGFVNAVLHHWGLDDRFTARTAFPVTLGGNWLLQPDGQFYDEGLSIVPGQPTYLYGANCATVLQGLGDLQLGQGCPGGRAINPNAFMNISSGLGNAPRNFVRGFGAVQMDLAIRREFPIREGLKLQFRAEAFNIFNHPNFGRVNSTCGGTPNTPGCGNIGFGQATSTLANSLGVLNPLYQMGGPRSMQFALKLVF